jgi:protein ImuB
MVGPNHVGGAELLDTHAAEGFRMQRFIPATPETSSARAKSRDQKSKHLLAEDTSSASPPDRAANAPITALRIFRPPLQATVTLRNGQPMHLVCPRRKEVCGEILWMAGPWRSSGDWWEQDGWSRDEWDIALQLPVAKAQLFVGSGQLSFANGPWPEQASLGLYRLVHDLLNNRWFVEGTYD